MTIINSLIYNHTTREQRFYFFIFVSEFFLVHIICKKYIFTNCFFSDFNYKKDESLSLQKTDLGTPLRFVTNTQHTTKK